VAEAARRDAVSVAVVIPARNESGTIGAIVRAVRELPSGLVTEIVVVDSLSTDATAAVAAQAGARVVPVGQVLPEFPPRPGKGEAMWRGLAATSADLIVYLDGDLLDFDARIVPALVGPLLVDAGLVMVKAAYSRPGSDPARPLAAGGRVTELMARPLIGAFWPALAGVLQPLGGEYAARRSLLEDLGFRCGYGVELGLLVDTLHVAGADAIGQVDVGVRMHRNSDLMTLGKMSAEVLHTALARLESEGRSVDLDRSAIIAQPSSLGQGSVHELSVIDTAERPPLASLRRRDQTDQDDQVATM
jgi:glucosyl-3-phosphoglycerate synthase